MESRSPEYFVREVDSNFVCSICLYVMGNPYDTPCQHTFCFGCISSALKARSTCCDCREPVSLKMLKPSNFRFKSLLYEQRAYCDNRDLEHPENACKWEGEWSNLRDHLKNACVFVTAPCVYECGKSIRKCDIEKHQTEECVRGETECKFCKTTIRKCKLNTHLQVCTQVVLECKCGGKILRKEMGTHLSTYCPEVMVYCSFSQIGCEYQSLRKNMIAHIQSTYMEHVGMIQKILQQQTDKYKKDMDDITQTHEAKINSLEKSLQEEKSSLGKLQMLSIRAHQLQTKTQQLQCTNNELTEQNEHIIERNSFVNKNRVQFERYKIEFLKEKSNCVMKEKPHKRSVVDLALIFIALILIFLTLHALANKFRKGL